MVKDLSENIRRAPLEPQDLTWGNSAGLFWYYSCAAQTHFAEILLMEIKWAFSNRVIKKCWCLVFLLIWRGWKSAENYSFFFFFIACICICVCISPNIASKKKTEKDENTISQVLLTHLSKTDKTSLQPSLTFSKLHLICSLSLQVHCATLDCLFVTHPKYMYVWNRAVGGHPMNRNQGFFSCFWEIFSSMLDSDTILNHIAVSCTWQESCAGYENLSQGI